MIGIMVLSVVGLKDQKPQKFRVTLKLHHRVRTQRVSTQRVSTQRVSTQRVSTQRVSTLRGSTQRGSTLKKDNSDQK